MFQRLTDRRKDNSAIDNNNNQTIGSMRLSGANELGNLGMQLGMKMQVERRYEAGGLAEE